MCKKAIYAMRAMAKNGLKFSRVNNNDIMGLVKIPIQIFFAKTRKKIIKVEIVAPEWRQYIDYDINK